MEEIKFVFQFIKNLVSWLVMEGVMAIIAGVLIFIYPDLLGMLVGALLVISGIGSWALAAKVNRYSKISIKI